MLLPRVFSDHFNGIFDEMFSYPFSRMESASKLMNTDVQDLGSSYQLEIELPGYEKKDIHAQLQDGYLVISANKQETKEENDENGRYIRKERYCGSAKRSYYVGQKLKEEDFQASFENGVLKLVFPKMDQTDKIEEKKYIQIG